MGGTRQTIDNDSVRDPSHMVEEDEEKAQITDEDEYKKKPCIHGWTLPLTLIFLFIYIHFFSYSHRNYLNQIELDIDRNINSKN